ncbi:MAG: heme NO-binding domain-containing protein [Acidimicrobiaceae bacterium]|nr:heme NO-binding domain-containing protein [Acidimicrobiaceae bacterium]MBT5849808.1 heme NO-binding domain-containing protein [Acidimicrobiaceae bacterium]
MKGIIFNVAEEVVTDLYGADDWDSILASAELEGAYTSLGNYDDSEIAAIIAAASVLLEVEIEETWRIIGRYMLPLLARRIPTVTGQFDDARQFLLSVNDIIHPEVTVLYPDSVPPLFDFVDTDAGLTVRYQSARGLMALAGGLILGCGDLFGETVTVETLDITSPTDCTFRVSFSAGRA